MPGLYRSTGSVLAVSAARTVETEDSESSKDLEPCSDTSCSILE